MSALSQAERHQYGMCGGACPECYADAEADAYRRDEERRHYEAAEREAEAAHYAAIDAENEWLTWLGVDRYEEDRRRYEGVPIGAGWA